jgi:hypothetical protein
MKKELKNKSPKVNSHNDQEENYLIPMKKEVRIEGAGDRHQPATVTFITSGFGKINVPNKIDNTPSAIAA